MPKNKSPSWITVPPKSGPDYIAANRAAKRMRHALQMRSEKVEPREDMSPWEKRIFCELHGRNIFRHKRSVKRAIRELEI